MDDHDKLIYLLNNPDSSSAPENPQWSELLAPYLENSLIHASSYTAHEIAKHVRFFVNIIAPHIGPGPLVSGSGESPYYQPQYPSSMTNDLTPFQLSLCWKERKQEGKPIVRFINDMIPPDGERTRAASLQESLRLIGALEKVTQDLSFGLTLHVLPDIWKAVSRCLQDSEPSIHPQGDCPLCGPSSGFIGFGLKRSVVSSKFYWLLPSCLDIPEVLNLMDSVFAACAPVHEFFASPVFQRSWSQIRQHVFTNPETLRPRMLSIDATAFPAPRIKFYTRCLFHGDRGFDSWKQHLRFNESITCPDGFLSTCRDLWTSLVTAPDEWASTRPGVGPKYCLILYELTASSSTPTVNGTSELRQKISSKLYVMCQEIPHPDSFIATHLLRHCNLAAESTILRAFAAGTKPTNFISEIGLAPRTEGAEASIYLSPSFFARRKWATAEDGYFCKPRITLPN
ncbi:hypothetical protein EYZ11_011529 [Aspergillus tanneri]|uniref:Aromatic prenyltransferase (DMATS family) n=1 Tax=Aspergillus tanneri TaxID=1220188 RepID=A0A4S3J2J7_9EURO|nr:uncharacterized protein ATNIH1004_009404 [Aspergillus tanneri]KAA8645187.1 hypothetical protein ATNIH1004_009404 [Aspergillus tanneri]THC89023.1 hypothetical protein EYZ11_011529 [Aspergillus tanneri]